MSDKSGPVRAELALLTTRLAAPAAEVSASLRFEFGRFDDER